MTDNALIEDRLYWFIAIIYIYTLSGYFFPLLYIIFIPYYKINKNKIYICMYILIIAIDSDLKKIPKDLRDRH